MAPIRPAAAACLVPGAPLFCASSGFGAAAADRRKPTNGSSAPAESRRNRERDRAACDKRRKPELPDSISLLPCPDMGTSGVRSSGLQDASGHCLAVEPTADVRDRIL